MVFQVLKKLAANEACRAAFILIAVLQICFYPCFWGGKTLLASAEDAPVFSTMVPLWDPYQAYGEPLAANMQSQPFYPLTLALGLHLTPRTYKFYILLRLFVAGICTYFYLRLFLSFTAAIAGGIASMLTGYYIIFITMPHLSVEILSLAVLLAGEYLLRKKTYRGVVWLAIVVMLVFLGGMPESALLLPTFGAAYLLFRVLSDSELRVEWKRSVALLSAAAVAGVCLSIGLPTTSLI